MLCGVWGVGTRSDAPQPASVAPVRTAPSLPSYSSGEARSQAATARRRGEVGGASDHGCARVGGRWLARVPLRGRDSCGAARMHGRHVSGVWTRWARAGAGAHMVVSGVRARGQRPGTRRRGRDSCRRRRRRDSIRARPFRSGQDASPIFFFHVFVAWYDPSPTVCTRPSRRSILPRHEHDGSVCTPGNEHGRTFRSSE